MSQIPDRGLTTADLSLEQAPPISVPFRFFLTAPLFALAGGVLLFIYGPEALSSRWAPATLALTHLYTLGVLAMVMCGAMMQMLPVLAGHPVPRVVLVGNLVHPLLTLGTIALAAAFLSGSHVVMIGAASMLGLGFLIFVVAVVIALQRIKIPNVTITGMRAAVFALAITVGLGLMLAGGLSGWVPGMHLFLYTDLHLTWGMLGWVGLLVVAVSYQMIPMFQVTPEYPQILRRLLVPAVFAALIIWSLLFFFAEKGYIRTETAGVWFVIPLSGLLLFAAVTLRLQMHRRRRISDVTLLFWRTGLIAMFVGGGIWILAPLFPALMQMTAAHLIIGIVMVLGSAVSLLNGMLYKIVPFLSWFHLQNRQLTFMCMTVQVPNMKQLLPDKAAIRQFRIHLAALTVLLPAVLLPGWFAHIAGLLLALSALLLWINLVLVVVYYRRTDRALHEAVEKTF